MSEAYTVVGQYNEDGINLPILQAATWYQQKLDRVNSLTPKDVVIKSSEQIERECNEVDNQ